MQINEKCLSYTWFCVYVRYENNFSTEVAGSAGGRHSFQIRKATYSIQTSFFF